MKATFSILNRTISVLLFFCMLLLTGKIAAQTFSTRNQIDLQRQGLDLSNDSALGKAREFIRMDSSYYVGRLVEGQFLYEHASDYQGYLHAILPLEKAKDMLLAEFGDALTMQYVSMAMFTQNLPHYQDYLQLCNNLSECYNNTDQPDKAMRMLDQMDQFQFRKDYFGISSHRAWIYHRYRVYTSKDFYFLKNSIAENEQLAINWCHIGLEQIEENKAANDAWFGPTQAGMDQLSIYHYLALILTYNKQYDSADYYYHKLEEGGIISWNNYGGLQAEIGNFGRAAQYYAADMNVSFGHMLQEPYYYLPELLVYKGDTKKAIEMSSGIIQKNGSMPGFGWYNIALVRAYLYDGQLDSARLALDKAKDFKEVSIGTTLTEIQYQFTTQVLQVVLLNREIQWEKFSHKNWWYSPKHLLKVIGLKLHYFIARYVVVNALGHDPDRERLVYDLFCSESTITFDEIWDLLQGFNDRFFIQKYSNYIEHDSRKKIIPYYQLFKTKFLYENGNTSQAKDLMEDLIKNVQYDPDNEKLFIARLYEISAKIYADKHQSQNANFYGVKMLENFAQLVPFSGLDITIGMHISGNPTTAGYIAKALGKSQVKWTENNAAPQLNIIVNRTSKTDASVQTELQLPDGKTVVHSQVFTIPLDDIETASNSILQKAFGIGL